MSSFPLRPADVPEGILDTFLRVSGPAWVVYLIYRLLNSKFIEKIITRGDIRNSSAIRGGVIFFGALLITYFTASFKTRVYKQSVT